MTQLTAQLMQLQAQVQQLEAQLTQLQLQAQTQTTWNETWWADGDEAYYVAGGENRHQRASGWLSSSSERGRSGRPGSSSAGR
jgi:hypothetical protein